MLNPNVGSALAIASQETAVADAVWKDYVYEALSDGRLQAKPDPIIVGTGLEFVQVGFDKQKKGVSAGKVVIKL
jgi:hypothetical protein